MLSAVARYKQLLSSALARYFPRTTAYLRAEREAAQPRKPVRKQSRKKSAGNKKASGHKSANGKPGPAGIYPATRLKIEDAQLQAMRERVAQAVSAGLIGAPSDEQWAMILWRASSLAPARASRARWCCEWCSCSVTWRSIRNA